MIEVVLLKVVVIALFALTMQILLDRYKEIEDLLHSRKMSWTQFEQLRNAIIGAGGISFIFVAFLLAL